MTIEGLEKIRRGGRILSAPSSVMPMTRTSGGITMDALVRPIIALHGVSNGILATGIGDLTDQEAKLRSRAGSGPSIAWTIGHLCHYKIKVLELLGHPRSNAFAAQFDHTPASDGSDYPPLADLAASFAALNGEVCAALASSADRLEAPMPGAGPHGEKHILDTVLFLAWHEAYHIGAIGAIRREQGRKAIAELVKG
jgi:DinB superfamily